MQAVLDALVDHGVKFILIGGQAGRAWGSPLVTEDFDAVYARDRANLERVVAALRELDAKLRVPGVEEDLPFQLDAASLERGFNFTFATTAGDVDLLGLPAGVDGYDELLPNFTELIGARAIIDVAVTRVAASCGYAVPLMDYVGQRTRLIEWAEARGPEGLVEYRRSKNATSIDGVPAFGADQPAPRVL